MQVLIISDVHANLAALDAVMHAAPPVDAVWNLGDTVGYGPRPAACLDRLGADQVEVSLLGNHDLAAIGRLDLTEFNPWARAAAEWTSARLSAQHRERLGALPPRVVISGVTLAHGSPREPIWEYVADQQTARANFAYFDTDLCFIGHTHVALLASQDAGPGKTRLRRFTPGEVIDVTRGRWLINPGSVGQPRDGDPRASYAVLDTDLGTVVNYRVAYDIPLTQRQMTEAGLPAALIERLEHGR